jgi:hypothetical protein
METTYILKVSADGRVEREPFDAADALGQLQREVGGYIERVPIPMVRRPDGSGNDLFVDEEGLQKALPLNTRLSFFCSAFLAGNAVFAAHDNMGETVGLSKDDADSIVKTINTVVF